MDTHACADMLRTFPTAFADFKILHNAVPLEINIFPTFIETTLCRC